MNGRPKLRSLYLLALFQLVAGPLVLFQVSVLSRVMVRDAPTHGIARAVTRALNSPEFRATMSDAVVPDMAKSKPSAPSHDPKAKPVKMEMPCIDWQDTRLAWINAATPVPRCDAEPSWTPMWPLPPPGPPPRVG